MKCIYHKNCLDGFTGAWIVKQQFPDAEFIPEAYHEEIDVSNLVGEDVIFVDFSTKRDKMIEIAKIAKSVFIMDHHISAEKELAGLENELNNVTVIFDMSRSGAMIAWDHYNSNKRPPAIIEYVQDRDLWTFKYPKTKAVTAYMRSLDQTFQEWDKLIDSKIKDVIFAGNVLERKLQKDVDSLIETCAFEGIVNGYTVLVANIPYMFASDAGHKMVKKKAPFSVTYFVTKDGNYAYSFRANGKYNVAKLAAKFGGGGHPNAAGCTTDYPIWKEI